MIVYRIANKKYKNDLSGRGAELTGGRWNSKGTAIVYTCESRALATAEITVHTPIGNIPLNSFLIEIEIPDSSITEIKDSNLPSDWKSFPHSDSTQKIGDKFIVEEKYLILKVPSAVVPGDYNYLINPRHKDFGKIKILKSHSYTFDERLFR